MKPENGLFQRGLKLGRLGANLTGSYIAYQVQNLMQGVDGASDRQKAFRARASKRVTTDLGELKGPVMKLGQVLSMMGHAIPSEALEQLAMLQGQAPAMHPTLARAQFKAAMGTTPEDLYAEFNDVPFAAASLGQVHRAKAKDGQQLAVKIQYPGIRAAIENDFKLLRSASLPGQLSGHINPDLVAEVQRGFLEETDYRNEAQNLKQFGEGMAPLSYLAIPEVREDLSSERVLTMSFIEGDTLDQFLAKKPRKSVRDRVGARLMEIYHFELRTLRAFHADPHPGNYLFLDDGEIGLVDFGCVKRCSSELSELVETLVCGNWREQSGSFERMTKLICGDAKSAKSEGGKQLTRTGIELYEKLFPEAKPRKAKVDFGKQRFLHDLTDMWNHAIRSRITNPEYAFASRAELGLCNLLHRFKAKIDTALVRHRVSEFVAGNLDRLD